MHMLVTLIAQYLLAASVVGLAYVFFRQPYQQKKLLVVAAVLGAVVTLGLARLGSALFYNPRPFTVDHVRPYFAHATGNGFPSDHTLAAAFIAFVVWKYNRRLAVILFVITLLIGAARIVAHVHHLIDIVGAIVVGLIGAAVGQFIAGKLFKASRYSVKR